MANTFSLGQKVTFLTNFYDNPKWAKGSGTINRFEKCGQSHTCTCGIGGTYFVKLDNEETVVAYMAIELAAANEQ